MVTLHTHDFLHVPRLGKKTSVMPHSSIVENKNWISSASITASATFGHSASPDDGTCWHIMALQGAMQVYVKYFGCVHL